jgi:hypothetical protein
MIVKLEELAPYLPYGLMILDNEGIKRALLPRDLIVREKRDGVPDYSSFIKPILRPLSDLTNVNEYFEIWDKETDHESIEQWIDLDTESQQTCKFSLHFWNDLYKHHFDVYGLLPKGLAIDINTLND